MLKTSFGFLNMCLLRLPCSFSPTHIPVWRLPTAKAKMWEVPRGNMQSHLGVDQCNQSETSCERWFWATSKQALVRSRRMRDAVNT
ncbi:hypothetical protein AOLI_G00268260 [Acnodon oligacanthus]